MHGVSVETHYRVGGCSRRFGHSLCFHVLVGRAKHALFLRYVWGEQGIEQLHQPYCLPGTRLMGLQWRTFEMMLYRVQPFTHLAPAVCRSREPVLTEKTEITRLDA